MSFLQVPDQVPTNGKYIGFDLDPGASGYLRRRAVGINPQSGTIKITRPQIPGVPITWPTEHNAGNIGDGGLAVAWNAGVGNQGLPALQKNEGYRGAFTFGNPGTNTDRRVGFRSQLNTEGDKSKADYFFKLNGYNWSCHTAAAGGVDVILAQGTSYPKDLYQLKCFSDKMEYWVGGQLVYTAPNAPTALQYYPCWYLGTGLGGQALLTWGKMEGNLAVPLKYANYTFGGTYGWNNTSTAEGSGGDRSSLAPYGAPYYEDWIDIRFTKGLFLNWPQGRGIQVRLYLNGEIIVADWGVVNLQYTITDMPVPEIGYNVLRVAFAVGTYYTVPAEYSLLYV